MATIRLPEALTSSAPVSRRAFATTLGAGGLAIAAIASVETALARNPLALATATSPNRAAPAASAVPAWTLTVSRGAVSVDLTNDVLDRFHAVSRVVTEPGAPSSTLSGVALADLLSAVGAGAGARIRATGLRANGSSASAVLTPAQVSSSASLVATMAGGRPLSPADGGPARLVAPGVAATGSLVRIEVLG